MRSPSETPGQGATGHDELAYSSATELLRLIAAKQVSPLELTEFFLDRIERLDGRLHSFLLLTPGSGA